MTTDTRDQTGTPVRRERRGVMDRRTKASPISRASFRMTVPPGRYDVAIDGRFVQYDINQLQHGITKLPLVAGQGAQFQFVPR